MTGILMTQVSTPIIGQAAWLLGKIMDIIYRVMSGVFGIENVGVCIIMLTVVVYSLLYPMTFSELSSYIFFPEIDNKKQIPDIVFR